MNTSDNRWGPDWLLGQLRVFRHAQSNYRALKRWRSNVCGGTLTFRSELPCGIFSVQARSALATSVFWGTYEPDLMRRIASLRPHDGAIINVGANIGFYAVHLANVFRSHHVIAVEPNAEAFDLLCRNIRDNRLDDRIEGVHACVFDRHGKVDLSYVPGCPEYSSIGSIHECHLPGERRMVAPVPSYTLAQLANNNRVSILVMDTEGSEMRILASSVDIIKHSRPIIVTECADRLLANFGDSAAELVALLRSLQYDITDPLGRQVPQSAVWSGNLVAVPR